jgi:hypothetical protein
MDRFVVQNPVLLPGIRYYVDASTTPDQSPISNRTAGIGVFIVNQQVQPVQTIDIRAHLSQAHSVLMAEAAALALAATIADQLHYHNVSFLSDC